MSGPIKSILDRMSFALRHSVFPSPSVVVEKIAFAFRALAFVILAPLVLIGLLDIIAYAIARTLRAPKDKQRRPELVVPLESTASSVARSRSDLIPRNRMTSSSSSIHGRPAVHGEAAWFTFPAADEKLSGVGIFSPPISRSPTPSGEPRSISSSLFTTLSNSGSNLTNTKTLTPPSGWEPVAAEDVRDQEGYEGDISVMSEDASKPQLGSR